MMAMDLVRNYLLSKRSGAVIRTVAWICILGVATGVMALVFVLSVMNGLNDSVKQRLLAAEPHLQVILPEAKTSNDVEASSLFSWLKQDSSLRAEVFETQEVILRTNEGLFGGAIARGVESHVLQKILIDSQRLTGRNQGLSHIEVDQEFKKMQLKPGEILMGRDLAYSLGVFEGDKIVGMAPEVLLLPKGEAPPLEQLYVRRKIMTNVADVDAKVVFYDRKAGLPHLGNPLSREVGIEIWLADPENFKDLKLAIEKRGGVVSSWIDRNSSLFYALKLEKISMASFLSLTALISGLCIVTVLVLLLTQKRKDIGLLMALGLSPRRTRILFAQFGAFLASIGVVTGLVLGVVLALIVSHYPIPLLPAIYYDRTIPARVDPLFLMMVLFFAGVLAFLSAWVPAKYYTDMSPSEALRGK